MVALTDIYNFRSVDDRLFTSGQPTEQQLAAAAASGIEVVINLAVHDDPRYSLKDEAGAVEALGMDYIHIPVQFASPTKDDFQAFAVAMDANASRKVLVHCAANMRVTAFIGLYRVLRHGWKRENAFALMDSVWKPNEVWATFIEKLLMDRRPEAASGERRE
jgi:uncharacterized protein (TIGR01244 family)